MTAFKTLLAALAVTLATPSQHAIRVQRVEAVQVITAYEQSILFNNRPTTRNTVFLTATESDSVGTLRIGTTEYNITATPPSYNFNFQEVGAVPENTELHINQMCFANDAVEFLKQQQKANALQGLTITDTSTPQSAGFVATPPSPARRRLLATCPLSDTPETDYPDGFDCTKINKQGNDRTDGSFLDYFDANKARDAYNKALRAIDIGSQAAADVQSVNNSLKINIESNQNVSRALDLTNKAVAGLTNITDYLEAQNLLRVQAIVDVEKLIDINKAYVDTFYNASQIRFNDIDKNFQDFARQTNQSFLTLNAETKQSLLTINENIISLNSRTQDEFLGIIGAQVQTLNTVDALTRTVANLALNQQLARGLTSLYYEDAQRLSGNLKTFSLGLGIPPSTTGLIGTEKRVLLDQLFYNYVSPTSGSRYTIYSSNIQVYLDSVDAIDNARFVTNEQQLASKFGESTCYRAYSDPDTPVDAETGFNRKCNIWMEVRTAACTSNRAPKFTWNSYGKFSIGNELCEDQTNGAITATPVVLRSLEQVRAYFANNLCGTQEGAFQTTSTRQATIFNIASNTTASCRESWKEQSRQALLPAFTPTLLYQSMNLLKTSFQLAFLEIGTIALKLYGRIPGGVDYTKRPADFVPVDYAEDGTPIYNAAAEAIDCTYASWLAVDKNTIPLYSVQPNAAVTVNKAVQYSISAPVCTNANVCYPVTEGQITTNIALNDDASHLLPGSFLMVGDLTDLRRGLYDIPARSLSASSSTAERRNTPSYILMPPGTKTTFDLPDWIARNTALFEPDAGSVSPGLYKFNAKYDLENYPYCDIPSATPVIPLANLTTRGCVSPYNFTTVIPSPYTSQLPAQCRSVPSGQLYFSRRSELLANTLNITANSVLAQRFAGSRPTALSFMYRRAAGFGDNGQVSVFQVNSGNSAAFIQFLVNDRGQPVVLGSNFASNSSLGIGVDLRDGLWHFVAWQTSRASNVITLELNIDGVSLGSTTFATPTFSSLQPTIRRLSDQLPTSQDAELQDVYFYDTPNALDLQFLRLCALTRVSSLCVAPAQTFVFARQNATTSSGVINCNPTDQLLRSELAFDTTFPIDTTSTLSSALTSDWGISFFIRGSRATANQNLLNVAAGQGRLVVQYIAGSSVSISINGVSTLLSLFDGVSHSVVVSYTAFSNQAVIYWDRTNVVTVNAPGSPVAQAFQSSTTFITQVKLHQALTPQSADDSVLCQLQPGQTVNTFLPPTGYCALAPGETNGYCRQSSSCAGHCTVYSSYDAATHTFAPKVNECDDGWAAPSCIERCSRVDSVTGVCLDISSANAVGLVPGSELCQLLLNYKLSVNPAAKTFRLTPRKWQYSFNFVANSGVVTNVINTGSCPSSTVTPSLDGSIRVELTNSNSQVSIVNILYAPDSVTQNGEPCTLPCCNVGLDNPVSIPANSVFSRLIPSAGCGNVSVIVQQAFDVFDPVFNTTQLQAGTQCSAFSAQEVQQQINTPFNQAVPTNVQASILIAQEQTGVAIRDVSLSVASNILQLLQIGTQIGFNSSEFNFLVDAQSRAIANSTFNPLVLNSLPPFDLSAQFNLLKNQTDATKAALAISAQQARESSADVQRQLDNVRSLLGQSDELVLLAQLNYEKALAALQGVLIQRAGPDEGGGGDFFGSFVDEIGPAILKLANVTPNFIDDLLNGAGVGGGLFGSLFAPFLKILPVLLGLVVGGAALYFGVPVLFRALSSATAAKPVPKLSPRSSTSSASTQGRMQHGYAQVRGHLSRSRKAYSHSFDDDITSDFP